MISEFEVEYGKEFADCGCPKNAVVHLSFVDITKEDMELIKSLQEKVLPKSEG